MNTFNRLKTKWGIKSNLDFVLINVVFALAGMSIVYVRPPLFHVLGLTSQPFWVKCLVYIPLVFPIYQIHLLIFGFLLGQFPFFWNKEKQMIRFIFRRKSIPAGNVSS